MTGMFSRSKEWSEDEYRRAREDMVERQIARRDVSNRAVLAAMRKIPRHEFVGVEFRREAYEDTPLPIGFDQTISQPYVVASMTAYLNPSRDKQVLEIGTGCGYQTAVLAELFDHVHTVECISELSRMARQNLTRLGYANITFHIGDGLTAPEKPECFDAIIVTCAALSLPDSLVRRLYPGGRMVIPVGRGAQNLYLVVRNEAGEVNTKILYAVRFVPMQGDEDAGI